LLGEDRHGQDEDENGEERCLHGVASLRFLWRGT